MTAKKTDAKRNGNKKELVVLAAVTASIGLNVIFLGSIIAAKTGVFDYAIVNNAHNVMCSDSFRDKVFTDGGSGDRVAALDYQCQRDDNASHYFMQGYNDYLKSQGLTKE